MILVLAASSWVSDAPALTAFKVYQMLVSLLFAQTFVARFGAWTSLNAMLWGNALLCAVIAFCAFFIPDEVGTFSEFNADPSRLFGGRNRRDRGGFHVGHHALANLRAENLENSSARFACLSCCNATGLPHANGLHRRVRLL
jgi:hypothetical protein